MNDSILSQNQQNLWQLLRINMIETSKNQIKTRILKSSLGEIFFWMTLLIMVLLIMFVKYYYV